MSDFLKKQKQISEIFKKYQLQGTKMWTYETASHDLQYQIGKLSKCILQLGNFRYRDNSSDEKIKENLSDELVDIIAEVLFIANELSIDLDKAWDKMIETDEQKIDKRK